MYSSIEDLPLEINARITRVLEKVNQVRTALAFGEGLLKELPQGKTGDEKHCVLALALSNGWQANVGAEEVHMKYKGDPADIDWNAVTQKLKDSEFVGVRHADYTDYNEETNEYDLQVNEVSFFDEDFEWFIEEFDNGTFAWLVLND